MLGCYLKNVILSRIITALAINGEFSDFTRFQYHKKSYRFLNLTLYITITINFLYRKSILLNFSYVDLSIIAVYTTNQVVLSATGIASIFFPEMNIAIIHSCTNSV